MKLTHITAINIYFSVMFFSVIHFFWNILLLLPHLFFIVVAGRKLMAILAVKTH